MWQRFSEAARNAVFYAQEEAQRSGGGYVSTEHLLLGLLRETGNTACRTLDRLCVSPASIRSKIAKLLPESDPSHDKDMVLTPRGKRVIDLAYEESKKLSNNYIGTEHLLLGVISEGDGLAGRVLAQATITLEAARDAVIEVQADGSNGQDDEHAPATSRAMAIADVLKQKLFPPETKISRSGAIATARSQMVLIKGPEAKVTEMAKFLKALQLLPITWEDAQELVPATDSDLFEVLENVFTFGAAGIFFLPEPDDILREGLSPTGASFTAGVAYGLKPSRAILVRPLNLSLETHLMRHSRTLSNSEPDRVSLIVDLRTAGCSCITKDDAWKTAGDFGGPYG
jgi:hypothetical protein